MSSENPGPNVMPTTMINDVSSPQSGIQASSEVISPGVTQDRAELLSRARDFLMTPQIMQQGVVEKRRFLIEKGLNDSEINSLLHALHPQRPAIPPRAYPQLPPSNLPTLLLGLFRLFSWITGGSAVLLFIYRRFLLPRVIHTTLARQSIKSHHLSLLRQLNVSLASLKNSLTETYKVLPLPEPLNEPPQFEGCHTITDVLAVLGDEVPNTTNLPPITMLRCGINHFSGRKEGDHVNPTTVELFQYLESEIPWLTSEEGLQYEGSFSRTNSTTEKLWEILSNSPRFTRTSSSTPGAPLEDQQSVRWTYTIPAPTEPSPVLKSIHVLAASMPTQSSRKQSSFQHTLQSLSDLTGYITTQVYIPYRVPPSAGGLANTTPSAEEEFRREIRALKGLVLNRRTFMPSTPRFGSGAGTP